MKIEKNSYGYLLLNGMETLKLGFVNQIGECRMFKEFTKVRGPKRYFLECPEGVTEMNRAEAEEKWKQVADEVKKEQIVKRWEENVPGDDDE